ncbi:hypothetical protein C8J56DRAFT_1156850 [Mycena floridula]|nr:hypothetical protein C8J56DRAFT_1156850 [Mycena floridula]
MDKKIRSPNTRRFSKMPSSTNLQAQSSHFLQPESAPTSGRDRSRSSSSLIETAVYGLNQSPTKSSRLPRRAKPPPLPLLSSGPMAVPTGPRTPTRIPIRGSISQPTAPVLIKPGPRPFSKPDPRLLIRHMKSILGPETVQIQEALIDDLCALHERELMEKEEKEALKSRKQQGNLGLSVFGSPLRQVSMYACTTVLLGDYEHDLPILVFACVEELYRLGLSSSAYAFEDSPSARVIELQEAFDSSANYGFDVSLGNESEQDIYALLIRFFSLLPEPILGSTDIVEARSVVTERQKMAYVSLARLTKPCLGCRYWPHCARLELWTDEDNEHTQTILVQHLLRLLPSANLSMFVYFLAFLNQILQSRLAAGALPDQVDTERENLALIFGSWIFGKRGRDSWGGSEDTATVLMVWFLMEWEKIADGLFSLGKGRSRPQPTTPVQPASVSLVSPLKTSTITPVEEKEREESLRSSSPEFDPLESLLDLTAEETPTTPTLADTDVHSICSSRNSALDERLLDLTLPSMIEPESPEYAYSDTSSTTSPNSIYFGLDRLKFPLTESGFLVLETKMRGHEMTRSQSELADAETKIMAIEYQPCGDENCNHYVDLLERQLQLAVTERDEARDIIEDIRKIMFNDVNRKK